MPSPTKESGTKSTTEVPGTKSPVEVTGTKPDIETLGTKSDIAQENQDALAPTQKLDVNNDEITASTSKVPGTKSDIDTQIDTLAPTQKLEVNNDELAVGTNEVPGTKAPIEVPKDTIETETKEIEDTLAPTQKIETDINEIQKRIKNRVSEINTALNESSEIFDRCSSGVSPQAGVSGTKSGTKSSTNSGTKVSTDNNGDNLEPTQKIEVDINEIQKTAETFCTKTPEKISNKSLNKSIGTKSPIEDHLAPTQKIDVDINEIQKTAETFGTKTPEKIGTKSPNTSIGTKTPIEDHLAPTQKIDIDINEVQKNIEKIGTKSPCPAIEIVGTESPNKSSPGTKSSPNEATGTKSSETSPNETPNRRKRKLYTQTQNPDVSLPYQYSKWGQVFKVVAIDFLFSYNLIKNFSKFRESKAGKMIQT